MPNWLSCFDGCFAGGKACRNEAYEESSSRKARRSSSIVVASDWQTVPDDVLQAVLGYLDPAAAAAAGLTCRRWHTTLSSYTQHLTIPLRFLGSKGARGGLRRAGCVFPSVRHITLTHADGWCDPVQARMDVEPLVRLESRIVNLEPLAVGIPQITHVTIRDATFTRDPWCLSQLSWLKGLRGVRVLWDTALWAPGQVIQEGEALQAIFSLPQLTELTLSKNAYLFLGEICLTDATLAAAAALRNLIKLDLSTIRVQDEGFRWLGVLSHLTHLSLQGQINVTLGVLHEVLSNVTGLEELNLGVLVPSNDDLRRIAAAHAGHRSSSNSRHRRSSRQQQQQSADLGPGSSSSSSSSSWRNAFSSSTAAAAAAHQCVSSSDISIRSTSSSSSSGSSWSSSSSRRPRFSNADWTAVFSPLQQLRKLRLHSDLVLLGSCCALRNLASLTHIELHGGAKFLTAGPYASLPPSWISRLAEVDQTAGPCNAAAAAGSSSTDLAAAAADGGVMLSRCGAWPALRSLQIDGIQCVDDVISGVRQLISLETLVMTGPCLFAHAGQQQQQQMPAAAAAPQPQHGHAPGTRCSAPATHSRKSSSADSGSNRSDTVSLRSIHEHRQQQLLLEDLRGMSAMSSSPQPPEFWGSSSSNHHQHTPSSSSSSSDGQLAGSIGAAGSSDLAAAAAAAGACSILAHDADMLTRLSPLENLQCFHLHLPQNMPTGLSVTPFALAHLAPSWTQLTSLDLDLTAAAAEAGSSSSSAGTADQAGLLLSALHQYTGLRDLTLRMSGIDDALSDSSDDQGGPHCIAAAAAAWSHLPHGLVSLSLHDVALEGHDLLVMGAATPALRHLRLLHCHISSGTLWHLSRAWPHLHTLIMKEAPLAGVGTSGVAAVAGLGGLRCLGLTLEPGANISSLAELTNLRYLLLDGRSNAEFTGGKSLRRLSHLKALLLPLLHIHHSDKGLLVSLQMALPNTVINNISCNFGHHRGYQWYSNFYLKDREWWREPEVPWNWYPTLCITL